MGQPLYPMPFYLFLYLFGIDRNPADKEVVIVYLPAPVEDEKDEEEEPNNFENDDPIMWTL